MCVSDNEIGTVGINMRVIVGGYMRSLAIATCGANVFIVTQVVS